MRTDKYFVEFLIKDKDKFWLLIWICGLLLVWIWNKIFLHGPDLKQLQYAFVNTMLISLLVIVVATLLAWISAQAMQYFKVLKTQIFRVVLTFVFNIIRSIPQIVGVLIGYVLLTLLIQQEAIEKNIYKMILMASILSLFIFLEVLDLLIERIEHFKKLDFFDAMRVCGLKESRIINREILLRSSYVHIFNKLIAIFGIAIFLQCSIDFMISVGLSTEISSVNLPVTLGSLLAKIDSKQDILALGYALSHWTYLGKIFFEHLQGITVAFLIVFSLLCVYHISKGYTKRHRL